jgi:hypothetical protein
MSSQTDVHVPSGRVIVACADLMTASNLRAGSQLNPELIRTPDLVVERVAADPLGCRVVVVDLQTMPDLPRMLRNDAAYEGVIVGFAPHVRTDLIHAARPWVTKVVARGAVVQRFDALVTGLRGVNGSATD